MTEYLSLDAPRVSRDTALELMVHHLQLAHMYFQATDDDVGAKRDEAVRLFTEAFPRSKRWRDDGGIGYSEEYHLGCSAPEVDAGLLWLDRMECIYEEMKSRD